MHLGMLLQMAADGMGDRIALGSLADGMTMADLADRACAGHGAAGRPGSASPSSISTPEAVPIPLFGARRSAASRSCRSTTGSPTTSCATSWPAPPRRP